MTRTDPASPRVSLPLKVKLRNYLYQAALTALVLLLAYFAVRNAVDNLTRAKIATGFGFLSHTAGFDISQTLIEFTPQVSTYGRAFWVGLLNTFLVAGIGIVLATILGFAIGIARLSSNWLVSRITGGYIEVVRNIPLLLQLYFWYNAVLKALPDIRESIAVQGTVYLNNRGLFVPKPIFEVGAGYVLESLIAAIALAIAFSMFAGRHQRRTGRRLPVWRVSALLIVVLPAIVYFATGTPVELESPRMGRFNISGGVEVLPEFAALLFGLVIYTAAFIAEAVRAGISAVAKGQTEAAYALGLRPGPTTRLVIIPQAMRVIVPPLTNQYLNLTKNSSLAVAIGYPDFVQVFTGSVLVLTGQAVEVVAITMAVYLTISLVTSALLNWFNARIALVER